jgi:quinol monooxygenase YgiN
MVSQRVYLYVRFAIQAECLEEFQKTAETMTALTRHEPGTLGYEWFFSGEATQCRLVETYADAGAVLAHLGGAAVQEHFPQLLRIASISGIEVYGDPGPEAAKILLGFGAEIFQFGNGLGR